MKNSTFGALAMSACALATVTINASAETARKGTVCFANGIRHTEVVPIFCKGLGHFTSIAEIYEHGYRVVSSGVLNEPGGTVYLIIEEQKAP